MTRMQKWMKTTQIVAQDVTYQGVVNDKKPKVWYVNDRLCPRAPNPIWVDEDNKVLGPYSHGGVTSSGWNTTHVFELIDKVMDEFIHNNKEEQEQVSKFRKRLDKDQCQNLGAIEHFTDVLGAFDSIWDRARDIMVMQITAEKTNKQVKLLTTDAQAPGKAHNATAIKDAVDALLNAGEAAGIESGSSEDVADALEASTAGN